MEAQQELIIGHIALAISAILPALLMRLVDLEKPNHWIGYRTSWSLKSDLTWQYANKKSADYLLWSALITIVFQLFAYFTFDLSASLNMTTAVYLTSLFFVIGVVERNLRKIFNKDGSLKNPSDEVLD